MRSSIKTDRFTSWEQSIFLLLATLIALGILFLFPNGIGASLVGVISLFYHRAMSEADYLLAEFYEKIGKYEKALEAVSRQIEITENRLAVKSGIVRSTSLRDCYLERAYIYEKLGRSDDAKYDETVALSLDLSMKIANARNRFMESLRSRLGRPSDVQYYLQERANAYESLGKLDLAENDRQAAFKLLQPPIESTK